VPSPSRVGKGRRRGPPAIRRRPSPINTVLLLVAQGTADTVNPPGAALSFTTGRMGQNDTLTWLVPGQLVPYSGANATEAGPSALKDAVYRRVVARVRTEFFEAELSATSPTRQAATRSLAKAEDVSSVADGYVRPRAPTAASYCPGAPAWTDRRTGIRGRDGRNFAGGAVKASFQARTLWWEYRLALVGLRGGRTLAGASRIDGASQGAMHLARRPGPGAHRCRLCDRADRIVRCSRSIATQHRVRPDRRPLGQPANPALHA
jgi:hypothetical protein